MNHIFPLRLVCVYSHCGLCLCRQAAVFCFRRGKKKYDSRSHKAEQIVIGVCVCELSTELIELHSAATIG